MKKYVACLAIAVSLNACGPSEVNGVNGSNGAGANGISGTYKSDNSAVVLVFSPDGQVTYKHPKNSEDKVTTYTVKDGKISYQLPGGGMTMTMSINEDGTLSTSSAKYEKQD